MHWLTPAFQPLFRLSLPLAQPYFHRFKKIIIAAAWNFRMFSDTLVSENVLFQAVMKIPEIGSYRIN